MRLVGIVALLALVGCSDGPRSKSAAEAMGFTNVVTTGWAMYGCATDDAYCTGFEATAPGGRRVTGIVGCGRWYGKLCTVRVAP